MYAQAKTVLDAMPEIQESKPAVSSLKGNIEVSHVNFRYLPDSPLVLKDISIKIAPHEFVAIVGGSGSGKSTLIRILLGFEKPVSGNIYFGDKNINEINLQSLRSKIGSVLQNGGIFHADIMSNILITAPNLGEKEAWEAAEIAGIAEDIRNMPMGMRTVISEGQGGISGGQKQRIMIARAIINKPKILVFDEATSALDNRTQKSISDAIGHLNCTRVVIAHRLSTIKNCDRILYLEHGEIVEEGTYDELVEKKGRFFELIERQRVE
jgi:ABC-type bacteriocin/lantibiotic exporter with double-glycine peptidase domain